MCGGFSGERILVALEKRNVGLTCTPLCCVWWSVLGITTHRLLKLTPMCRHIHRYTCWNWLDILWHWILKPIEYLACERLVQSWAWWRGFYTLAVLSKKKGRTLGLARVWTLSNEDKDTTVALGVSISRSGVSFVSLEEGGHCSTVLTT